MYWGFEYWAWFRVKLQEDVAHGSEVMDSGEASP